VRFDPTENHGRDRAHAIAKTQEGFALAKSKNVWVLCPGHQAERTGFVLARPPTAMGTSIPIPSYLDRIPTCIALDINLLWYFTRSEGRTTIIHNNLKFLRGHRVHAYGVGLAVPVSAPILGRFGGQLKQTVLGP
jgi:hypothetical protein